MKLRIRGNSIRLRVTQGEIAQMAQRGTVRDGADFGNGMRLDYVLAADQEADEVRASYMDDTLTVILPKALVDEWVGTDRVSILAEQPLNDDDSLRVLVEKDFQCLQPREDEDDSDLFINPSAAAER